MSDGEDMQAGALDEETRVALEWQALLGGLAAFCVSSSGKARLLALEPLPTLAQARARNRVVAEMLDVDRLGLGPTLRAFPDVTEALQRTARGGAVGAAELWQVRELLELATELRVFSRGRRERHPNLAETLDSPAELGELEAELTRCLDPDGSVADRASPDLARARKLTRELREDLRRRLGRLLERHADVVQGDYFTEREGRYVLPVRSDAHLRVPGIVLGSSASGATLFVEPEELTSLGNQLRIQEAEALREAAKVVTRLCAEVAASGEQLEKAHAACSEADLLSALARFARHARAIVLELEESSELSLKAARHPLLALASGNVVASDIAIQSARALVISGPNAGGKTVALKTLGLVAWMARAGIPLPLAPESRVGWFETVLADIGDEQSIARSLSTFSAHVERLAQLLAAAAPGTLILLDEVASGTDPEEGAALAAAALEALTARGAAVAVTTHYERLKELAAHAQHLHNASVSYDFVRMAPTFRLTMGIPGASSALTVARRHGLPDSLVARAEALLPEQARQRELVLERLERDRGLLEREQQALDQERQALREERDAFEREHTAARAELEEELARETSALRQNVTKLRAELGQARERLKREALDPKALRSIDRDIARAAAHVSLGGSLLPGRESPEKLPKSTASTLTLPSIVFKPGESVRVRSSGLIGSVVDADGERLRVQVGSVKITLRSDDVEPAAAPARSKPAQRKSPSAFANTLPQGVRTSGNTLDLRGERVDDALGQVDAFLDRLLNANEPLGFVLHGHGTGALKSAVRAHLRASSYIEQSQAADADSGGDAFTVFWLRC